MSIPYDIVLETRRKLIQQSAQASGTYHIGAAPMTTKQLHTVASFEARAQELGHTGFRHWQTGPFEVWMECHNRGDTLLWMVMEDGGALVVEPIAYMLNGEEHEGILWNHRTGFFNEGEAEVKDKTTGIIYFTEEFRYVNA